MIQQSRGKMDHTAVMHPNPLVALVKSEKLWKPKTGALRILVFISGLHSELEGTVSNKVLDALRVLNGLRKVLPVVGESDDDY